MIHKDGETAILNFYMSQVNTDRLYRTCHFTRVFSVCQDKGDFKEMEKQYDLKNCNFWTLTICNTNRLVNSILSNKMNEYTSL